MTFIGRLENQHMKVPQAFCLPFKQRKLLFLGYSLDVWHYRLVLHIFCDEGNLKTAKKPFTVRQPASPMEEKFWDELQAHLILRTAESFAQEILSEISHF